MNMEVESPANPFVSVMVYVSMKLRSPSFRCCSPHAHVDKDDNYKNHGKGKDAVAYHKLFVGVQSVCHGLKRFFKNGTNVMNKFEPTGFLLAVFARTHTELFLEACREMGQRTESRHVRYL